MMLDGDLFEFLERAADTAVTVSDSGESCSWNASAERLFGFSARCGHWGRTFEPDYLLFDRIILHEQQIEMVTGQAQRRAIH